jgi:hypothetical protein
MDGTVDTGQININGGHASMGNNHDGELGMDSMDAPLCSRRMSEMGSKRDGKHQEMAIRW